MATDLKVEEKLASVEAKVVDTYHHLVELGAEELAKVKVFVEKLLARGGTAPAVATPAVPAK